MKFFRLDLLTLLISLFIFNACKRQDGIGLGVNDQNAISGNLIVDSNVIVNTVAEDTAATSGASKTPLANFVDPVFGTTQTNVAIGVNLPNNAAYTVPAGTLSIDSAVLVLRYADGFYGDSLASRYKISVYQVQNKVESKTYYTNSHWDANLAKLLGSKTFTARTHDSITIARIRTDSLDTVQRVPPQLRVAFDKAFIYEHLFNAPGSELSSTTNFQNSFKGLFLKLDRAQSSDAGGIIQLNLASSTLDVFYKVVNGTTIDTASVQLPFFNRAAEVIHTYPATITTALQSSHDNPGTSQNTIYMQGLAGLRAKVSFPGLAKLADSAIVLNRAEIVITPKAGSSVPYAPLPKLTMYKLDIAGQRALIQDASSTTVDPRAQVSLFGGSYNRTTKEYHFLVTAYVQDLIRKKAIDYGTYIAPVDTTLLNTTTGIDIAPTVLTAARSVLVGSDKTSPYSIRLNIIYTRIKQ